MNYKLCTKLRTTLVVLMCLLGISAWAGADAPIAGKTYRIRSIQAASYLTMSSRDDASVTLSENAINTLYQLWTVEVTGNTYKIKNMGWQNYLSCLALQNGALVNASSEPTVFTLKAENYANWDCFVISPQSSSLALNTDMNGSKFVLGSKTDNGSYWVFEEAELKVPQVVTLKSARSGKYITEDGKNALVQGTTVTDMAKWIKYEDMEGGIMFINYDTHNIIQTPQRNQQVKTGSDPAYFYADEGNGVWAFYSGGMFLNERNGNDVCGWNQGLNDAGSTWVVSKVADISEEEVLDILGLGSGYLSDLREGVYFRILNEPLSYYITDEYRYGRISGQTLDDDDLTQVWEAIAVGKDGFYIQNVVTGRRLTSSAVVDADVTSSVQGSVYQVQLNDALSRVNPYVNLIGAGGLCPLVTGDHKVTNGYPGSKEVSGAEWLLERIDKIDDNKLKDQKAIYEAFMVNYRVYESMLADIDAINNTLHTIFVDEACTELTAEARAMSDSQFRTAIASLPSMLQEICLKVKNNTWWTTNGGRQMERFFRVADYRAYSNSFDMRAVIGMSHEFTRMSNPTGVSAEEGEIIAIFVDDDCPAGATLMIEFVDGDEWISQQASVHGDTKPLHKGLNLFVASKSTDMFVFYEINSTSNTPSNYLERYPNIKIHIEGGMVNGYYDMTRDMTDADWSDMVASGMLRHGRIHLKGSHVLGNWPQSVLLKHNAETINDIASFYNNIVIWEQEMMGINDTYMPGITRRFNNILMCVGTQLLPGDYMYATSQGTFYNTGTLNDILSKNVLRNGGLQWGPSHEFGHNHQELFNMIGCTEVSNNAFSNMVVYRMGASMSRGVGLSALIPDYAANKNWIDHSIWCQTQMYWKLYQYFHLAGYDTEFYPKLFAILRAKPMDNKPATLVPASNDYLRFAEACCEAADADLSDFFEMYGFFAPITTNSTFEGTPCRYIDDYKQYYIYVNDNMIAASRARMQAYPRKITNIGFIDDRIRPTAATYPGAAAGTMRSAMNGGGSNHVGSEGTVGMYLDYQPANYRRASGYTLKNVRLAASTHVLTVNINNDGEGAMGFKVYDSDDHLLYFYNDFSFTVPASVYNRHPYTADNIIIVVADAQGHDQIVYKGNDYTGSIADGIDAATAVDAQPSPAYDLQGRRVSSDARGLIIVNGQKRIVR